MLMLMALSLAVRAQDYRVEGQARLSMTLEGRAHSLADEPQPELYDFAVDVRGTEWKITCRELSPTFIRDLPWSTNRTEPIRLRDNMKTESSDGTNTCFVCSFRPPNISTNTIVAFAWRGPGAEPIEGDEVILALWYGFASSHYLLAKTNSQMLPLHGATYGNDDVPRSATGSVVVNPHFPGLPVAMTISNLSGVPRVHPNFQTLQARNFTNVNACMVPLEITVDQKVYLHPSNELFATKRVDISVTNTRARSSIDPVIVPLPGLSRVMDLRYALATPPAVVSLTTNRWPSDQTVKVSCEILTAR